jgi:hypothetical protein
MKISGSFLMVSLMLLSNPVLANEPLSPCFDFSKPNSQLLRSSTDQFPEEGSEFLAHGWRDEIALRERVAWAEVRGTARQSIPALLKKLQDPMTHRDPGNTRVTATSVPFPGAWLRQKVEVKLKPVFFLTLEWIEEWMFVITDGTVSDPKKVLVSFQKTSGTAHIRRFCGNFLLSKIGPEMTGVTIQEEIIADRRKPEDVEKGLLGTLRTLRK